MLGGGKLIVEIRTLNGKTADINLKSQLLPKDRELEIRARLAQMLVRGTIDVFLTWEPDASDSGRQINMDIARAYMHGAMELASEMGLSLSPEQTTGILSSVLRMPEVAEVKKTDVLGEENWPEISAAFDRCIDMVCDYRSREGKALYADVTSRVATIVELYDKIEMLEDGDSYDGYSEMREYPYIGGSSYARGRGRYAKRDSMGRYSSDDRMTDDYSEARIDRRYSRDDAKDHLMDKMGEMMTSANEEQREILKEAMRKIERA